MLRADLKGLSLVSLHDDEVESVDNSVFTSEPPSVIGRSTSRWRSCFSSLQACRRLTCRGITW